MRYIPGNPFVCSTATLDVIKTTGRIIDLGPAGGDAGGNVVAQGTPEEVADMEASHTRRFLRRVL
jgi:excinuclease ABC subunit A